MQRPTPIPEQPAPPPAAAYAVTAALVGCALLVAVAFDGRVAGPGLSLLFVLPVVIAAAGFGWGPALFGAVVGVLAFNFFLVEPRYTFAVADPQNLWALGLLLAVAAIVSAVAAESRRRALGARRAADQAMALQALARALVGATEREAIAAASAGALRRLFGAPAVVLVETDEGLELAAAAGGAEISPADQEAARWAIAARLPTRAEGYLAEGAGFDFWPVVTPDRRGAALGLRTASLPVGRSEALEPLMEIVGGYLSVALAREALAHQAFEVRVGRAGERLKSDLLAAVSHDLKTPLSTILFTLQSLQRFSGEHDAEARAELLRVAERETARLSGLVGNLLDMGRLDAGAVVVRRQRLNAAELVARACERAAAAISGRILLAETGPLAGLQGDPQLAEAALSAILENAGKYSPPGSSVWLRSGVDGEEGWIEVVDEGPGFAGPVEPLFEKFARGVEGDGRPPGTGLGLAIARGFAEAQGGRVEAANRPDGGGAAVRLTLPLVSEVPDA